MSGLWVGKAAKQMRGDGSVWRTPFSRSFSGKESRKMERRWSCFLFCLCVAVFLVEVTRIRLYDDGEHSAERLFNRERIRRQERGPVVEFC